MKEDLLERTLAVWQPRTSRQLTPEDARQIAENMAGFFFLLHEWAAKSDGVAGSDHARAEAMEII